MNYWRQFYHLNLHNNIPDTLQFMLRKPGADQGRLRGVWQLSHWLGVRMQEIPLRRTNFSGNISPVQGIALSRAYFEAPSLNSCTCPREPPFPFFTRSCVWCSFSQLKLRFHNSIFYFLNMLYSSEISLVTLG